MSRNSTHINCNQIAGTVNQGIWLNDCDPCVESAYQIPNITQWLRYKFNITTGGTLTAGPISSGTITDGVDVDQWNDVIGTNHGVQATAGDKPHWADSDTSILFGGADEELDLTSVTYAAADDFVIVAGFTPTGGTMVSHTLWAGTSHKVVVTSPTTISVDMGGSTNTITGPTLAPQAGCDVYNITLRRSNGICQLFVAGVPWGPSFVYVGTVNITTLGGGNVGLAGKLFNFMQFDRALTDKEIWCLDCYLCGDDTSGEPTSCRIDHDKLDCYGHTDGSITATMLGATGAYTWLWSTGATTQTISSLGAGTYTCTMTDSASTPNVTTCTGEVTQPGQALACTTTTTQPFYDSTNVLQPATILVTVVGGWGQPLTNSNIAWTKDSSSYTPSGVDYFNISTSVAGTYAYTVTDVNGCECTGSVVITIPGDPTLEISCGHTPIECHDETAAWGVMFDPSTTFNTTASITMVGSVSGAHAQSPITVNSLPASSTNYGQTGNWWLNTVANQRLAAGEVWTITVTDTGSTVRTAQCTITTVNPEEIVITESITQPTVCEGLNWSNGSLSFIATGGTGAFTYEIEKTTATTSTIATNVWLNPGAGNYTLKATDANGCVVTKNVTITCPMDPMVTISHVATDMDCFGEKPCDGQVVFTPSATTSSGYTFTLTVSDGSSTILTVGPLSTFPAYTLTGLCVNLYTYTYIATLTSSGAVTTLANNVPFTISQPAALMITGVTTNDGCNGAPGTGAIDTTVSGGTAPYTYAWTTSGGTIPAGQADDPDLTTLVAGGYSVIVTDANGCTVSRGWDIGEPCPLDTTLTADEIECGDDGNGVEFVCNWTLDGHNGTLNQSWTWSHDKATMLDGTLYSPNGPAYYSEACWYPYHNGATNGTPLHDEYSATCRMQFEPGQGMVQQLSGLTIGETYNFSIDVGTGSTASGVWKMGVYTYGLPLTLLGSETSVNSTGVTTATFVATATDHIINVHYDGVAGAGSTGAWNQVLNTVAYDSGFGNVGAGLAMSSDGKTILTSANDQQEIITYKMCYNTTASYPYTGGQWVEANRQTYKNGNAQLGKRENVALSGDATKMIIGDQFWDGDRGRVFAMSWTETNATNCEGYWEQMGANFEGVSGDYLGTVAMSKDGSVVAIGYPNYNTNTGQVKLYTYDGSAWNQRGATIDAGSVGEQFGFSIDLSADGAEVVIGAPDHGLISLAPNPKGTVRVYEWSGSAWAQKGADMDGSSGDQFGYSVTINDDGTIIGGSTPGNVADSFKGDTRIYTYAGSSWSQTGSDIPGELNNDRSGNQIQLNGAGDIIVIGSAENDPNNPFVKVDAGHLRIYKNVSGTWTQQGSDIDHTIAGDYYGNDVDISENGLIVVGGIPFLGDNYEGGLMVHEFVTTSNQATGTGCLMTVSVTGQNVSSNTTDIIATTLCGTPGYTYAWTLPTLTPANTGDLGTNAATATDLLGVPAGTYQVVTTDANGCTDTASIVIAPGGNINNTISVTANDDCSKLCTGAAESDTQFANIQSYLWTTDAAYTTPVTGGVGSSNYNITEQCAGTYYLRVTLDNGCIWEGSCTITGGTSNMSLTAVITDADMCDDCCGDIDLTVTGGTAPYTYIWSNGQTTQDLSCVPAGSYTVQVTDDDGCQETATYIVGVSNYAITFSLSPIPTNQTIGVSSISGGTPVYSYQWTLDGVNYASGTTSTNTIPPLTATANGLYCLTVHDDLGCTETVCIGVDYVRSEVEEWNCQTASQECSLAKLKEDLLGACPQERSGKYHEVSGDGTTIVVGSPEWDNVMCRGEAGEESPNSNQQTQLTAAGRVKVFTINSGGTYTQKGQTLEGTSDNGRFGQAVSIDDDGNTVIVGSPGKYRHSAFDSGMVMIYEYNSTIDMWVQTKVIDSAEAGEEWGHDVSVSADGTRLVGVAKRHTVSGKNLGAVRVYDRTSMAVWTQKGADIDGETVGTGTGVDGNYIESAKLSNDKTTVAIGMVETDSTNESKVAVYRFSSSAWNQIGADIATTSAAAMQNAGSSVSLSTDGSIVAVGVPYWVEPGDGPFDVKGKVQIFEYSGSAWSQKGADIIGDNIGDAIGFKNTIWLSGDGLTLAAGSHFSSDMNSEGGKVQVYKFISSAWTAVCNPQYGNVGKQHFGISVSLNTAGTRMTVGSGSWSSAAKPAIGKVNVYDITFTSAGGSNICIPCYTLGCGTYQTVNACLAACAPSVSFNCEEGRCLDPGDGTGDYASEDLCLESGCTTLRTRYDCKKGQGCVGQLGVGTYASLAACQTACTTPSEVTYYCEILCSGADEAEKYKEDTEENRERYNDQGEEKERRSKEDVTTGGGRCRIRKDASPETGSTVYYATEKLCREACPWCKDAEKYEDIS